ncbi:dienelactone hydrolase family protein [Fimbriiglobus ruber]|uniref:Dienelactone hydrolase family n=1 Tax=Fimbriiglobus ruber TaxID=1908690 RepID=A0A225DUS9_9BACT|nr:dienelactone hydrolase family protein [Fimbriiglobus ruber]OWK40899.1 Dienelactone hydrolase family [Fimbriiglobus ruber]
MRTLLGFALAIAAAGPAAAGVQTKDVEYTYEGVTFKGQLAWDDATAGKRPGVLVVHEWWGLDDYAKMRAHELAKLGYVAFACDMYGVGKLAKHPEDAGKMATEVRNNVAVWQGRAKAALKVLADDEHVDASKLAAMGYCFGGSTALELAYSGADLKAVVTFHAALPTPTPEQAKAIKAKILVCHGADDKFIKQESIDKFKAALADAKVDLKFEAYPGAVHSFTVKGADAHMLPGMAYNAEADKKSWQAMQDLFAETLGGKK